MADSAYYRIAPRPAFARLLTETGAAPGEFPNAEVIWQFPENRLLEWERPEYNSLAKVIFLAVLAIEHCSHDWCSAVLDNKVLDDSLVDQYFEFEFQDDAPMFPDHYVPEDINYFRDPAVKGRLVAVGRQRVQEFIERRTTDQPSGLYPKQH